MDNKTGSNQWSQCSEKMQKITGKQWENSQTADSVFGTIWPSTDRKKGPKTVLFPNALSLRFHWDWPTIFAMGSYPKRQKKALFGQRSYSKGPNHALEKVLTNETPGIPVPITTLSCRIGSIRLFPE